MTSRCQTASVALLEILQQCPTCCPWPCVLEELQISISKNQYQFYFLHLLFQVFLQPNKQNLLCLKLSDYVCLFPELYIAVCILTHTKRHGRAPNMLALIATQGCWSFISDDKCLKMPFHPVCHLLFDYSLSLISLISPSKPKDYWNTKLILSRYHFLPFWHYYKLLFCLFSPFPAFFPLLSWSGLLICHSKSQLLSSSYALGHRAGAALKQCKRQEKWFLSVILLPENVQERAMVSILPDTKNKEKKIIRIWRKMCATGMWGLSVGAWALFHCGQ